MRIFIFMLGLLTLPPCTAQAGSDLPKCPGDKPVWINTRSGIYHFQGERWFGRTRSGKFLCKHDADAEGDRPTRNGQ